MPGNTGGPWSTMEDQSGASMRPQRNAGEYVNACGICYTCFQGFNEAPAKCRGIRPKACCVRQRLSRASMRPQRNAGEYALWKTWRDG